MYTTLFSLFLASAGLASRDVSDSPPIANLGGGYGSYGSYGAYGSFGGYASFPGSLSGYPGHYAGQRAWFVPYYVSPVSAGDHGTSPGTAKKEHDLLDKRFNELKTILSIYEEKIRGMEQKLQNNDANAETQVRILEIIDRKTVDLLEKYHARVMEGLDRKLADQAKILSTLQENQARAAAESRAALLKSDLPSPVSLDPLNQTTSKLQERIAVLEGNQKLAEQIHDALIKLGLNNKAEPKDPRWPGNGVPFNRGLIVVSLPADARLFLDGLPSAVGANLRSFISPELEVGKNYFYTLRAEVERDGKILVGSQRVYFQPGREVRASFDNLGNPSGPATAQGNGTPVPDGPRK